MEDSVFTKIIKGEIPSYKIYEDNKVMAFMDIHPVQLGMVLVVTKLQVPNFEDLPDEDYQALFAAVKKIALKLRQVFPGKAKIGVQIEGLDVPHVHIKMFPINSGEDFRSATDFSIDPDHDALAEMAAKLTVTE